MNKYGLLGEKLPHSYSPQIHSLLGSYDYRLTELDPEAAKKFLQKHDFDGYNVTIPYKKLAYECCDVLSAEARSIGSVNTLKVDENGRLCGFNTDALGFEYLLKKLRVDPRGKKCLVLGSGGSSVMAVWVLQKLMASQIVVISRSGENNYSNIDRHYDSRLIVNTTPVGMFPNCGISPIELENFKACEGLVDIIYNPCKTKLLLDAQKLGIPSIGGLSMLVAQAKAANEIFFGVERDDEIIDRITEKIQTDMLNILLVGMPGCGKTTIGTLLSNITGRELLDTDAIIQKKTGLSPAEIIRKKGESAFRLVEHEVINDVSKLSGKIIATGGGAVTFPQNLPLLRQNSNVFFINRQISELDTFDRPLSSTGNLEQMYRARAPLYAQVADFEIAFQNSKQCANDILHTLGIAITENEVI